MFDERPPGSGEYSYGAVAPGKRADIARQVFRFIDGVADALEGEWRQIDSARNLAWGDKLTIMELGIRRRFEQIYDLMGVAAALESQGRFGDPAALEKVKNELSRLFSRFK